MMQLALLKLELALCSITRQQYIKCLSMHAFESFIDLSSIIDQIRSKSLFPLCR